MGPRRLRAVGLSAIVLTALALGVRASGRRGEDIVLVGAVLGSAPADVAVSTAVRQGLLLALEDLERERGSAPRIELLLEEASRPAQARDKLASLHARGVRLVADVVGEEAALACAALVRERELTCVSGSWSPRAAAALGPRAFRVAPADEAFALGATLASWLRESGKERPALVHATGRAALRDGFAARWGGLSSQLAIEVRFDTTAAAIVERLLAMPSARDAVVIDLPAAEAGAVLAEARARGLAATFLGGPELGREDFARAATRAHLAGTCFLAPLDEPAPTARRAAVEEAWRSRFHEEGEPPVEALAAYDALTLLAHAAWSTHAAGTTDDLDAIAPRVRLADRDGATGRIRFDEDGDRRVPAMLRRTFSAAGEIVPAAL